MRNHFGLLSFAALSPEDNDHATGIPVLRASSGSRRKDCFNTERRFAHMP